MPEAPPRPWPAMSIAQAHALLTQPGSPLEIAEAEIRGIRTRVWKNAPPTLRELLTGARATYGTREFLVYEDDRLTYEDFYRAAVAIARELQRDGIQKGDRVALVMRNLPEWPAIFYGTAIVGAIVTPLNAWWAGAELEYGLADPGAKIVFADGERLERIIEHLPNCPNVKRVYASRYMDELPSPLVTRLEDVVGSVNEWGKLPDGALPDVPLATDDDATILYTSGTTGKPKGALGTHQHHGFRMLRRAQLSPAWRDAAHPQPRRSAALLAAVRAVLPRDGVLCDSQSLHRQRCQAGVDAKMGC
jgi:long-chain acyl-CoA synthetase